MAANAEMFLGNVWTVLDLQVAVRQESMVSQTLCFDAGSLTSLPVVCNWPYIALGHAGPQPIVDPHTVSRNQSHIFTLLSIIHVDTAM